MLVMLLGGCIPPDAFYAPEPPSFAIGERADLTELGPPVKEELIEHGAVMRVYQRWYGQELLTVHTINGVVVKTDRARL